MNLRRALILVVLPALILALAVAGKKPFALKLIWYSPGARLSMRKIPPASVVLDAVCLPSELAAVTPLPASGVPCLSRTSPVSVPVVGATFGADLLDLVCADARLTLKIAAKQTTSPTIGKRCMIFSCLHKQRDANTGWSCPDDGAAKQKHRGHRKKPE